MITNRGNGDGSCKQSPIRIGDVAVGARCDLLGFRSGPRYRSRDEEWQGVTSLAGIVK
jgi:hypothetical protein